ncbi:MAG: DUF2846 domain-containing protein [Bacteroidales bacterium]|nr:DUF2846 domain-containing protein [Bacteroidales bacterium]
MYVLKYFLFSIFLIGCAAKVPHASKHDDTLAKQFTVEKRESNIYIYQKSTELGAPAITIMMDDYIVGDIAPKTYLKVTTTPGRHLIKSVHSRPYKLNITTKAGYNYFVSLDIDIDFDTNPAKLFLVSSKVGKKNVLQNELAQVYMKKNIPLN